MSIKHVVVAVVTLLISAGMAAGQTEWTIHPDSPVIDPGPSGSWNDRGHVLGAVFFDGTNYHAWFTGVGTSEGFNDMGHATSPNGVEWTMDPQNPVLTRGAPGEWDDWMIFGAGVVHDGTQYHMWYSAPSTQDGKWRVGYATSLDGTVWTKHSDNPVLTPGLNGSWDDDGVDVHTVILENGTYKLWYSGVHGALEQIGYAYSTDGVHWTKHPNPVLEVGRYPGAWDQSVTGNPYVVFDGTTYHMWYTGGTNTSTTTSRSIGYAYSHDGIVWTKHGEDRVLTGIEGWTLASPVWVDGETFRMWYTQGFNSDGTWRIMYATSDCCEGVAGLTQMQTIPAAALASGAEGSFYQTDVDLNNAGDQSVQYQFLWFPRGDDNSEPVMSETFTLGAGMSVRYTNVLSEVFGLEPNALGALAIVASSQDLLAMSRTYNIPSAKSGGTFGQAMSSVAPSKFIQSGESQRILFASEHDNLRTNVGCQNGGGERTLIVLRLHAADGSFLGQDGVFLEPWGNDQLNRVFEDYQPVEGYVDVSTPTQGGSFFCYGSVLDNVTSDPTTIMPQ